MKKTVALLALIPWINAFAAPGWAVGAAAQSRALPAAPRQTVAADQDLIELLPCSTIGVLALDIKRILEIDAIVKAMEGPEFKKFYDEFVGMSGIDPKRDVAYVGMGIPASALAGQLSTPASPAPFKDFAIIIGLRSDKARLQGLVKEKVPEAKEEIYNGVSVFALVDEDKPMTAMPGVLTEVGKMNFQFAFLDASHIVLGSDPSVKGVIDVFRRKAEPLAKNSALIALINEVDKSGFAWGGVSILPELIKRGVETDRLFKAFEAVKGLTMALGNNVPGSIVFDIRFSGGTEEQNANLASVLTGLKAMGTMQAAQEPAMEVLMNGVGITSGGGHTRLSITLSRETWEALSRLAQSQAGEPSPDPPGAGGEWQALSTEADTLYRGGDHERALEAGRKALEVAEKNAGPDHPDVAVSLNLLALLFQAQGRYAEAEPLFKRALAIEEKAFGPEHPDLATCLASLASLYDAMGRYADAEPLGERALAIQEKALGPEHPDLAACLNDLASLYDAMGRYSEAEPLCKRALAIREKAFGPDHPHVAMSLDSLARILLDQDRYPEAEPLLERALAIAEKTSGPGHPFVATVLNDLGLLRLDQGRYADAEPLYLRSLEVYEKVLGQDHPSVAGCLNNLADLYCVQGRYAEAETLYDRSLTIIEKAIGPDHPLAAKSLSSLALLYGGKGQFELAEPLLTRSLTIIEKAIGPDHPSVAAILEMMAELYRATDREDEAEGLESRAARIRAIKR